MSSIIQIHYKKISITLLLVVFVVLSFLVASQDAFAQERKLTGWAWSDNIGWISFDCASNSSCSANHKVAIDTAGDMTGWAWSSNVGWIKFGGLSGFPGSGSDAQLAGSSLTGWIQAERPRSNPVNTADPNYQTLGGWDGWISLSGTAVDGSSYGATVDGAGDLSGFAWGSTVVGWVDMQYASIVADDDFNYTLDAPRVTLDAGDTASRDLDVTKTNTSADVEEVDVSFGTISPSGSGLVVTFDTANSCIPNTFCDLDFTVDATGASVGTYTVNFDGISAITNLTKNGSFEVEVLDPTVVTPQTVNVTCEVITDPSVVNQPITLRATITTTAPGPYDYTWSGDGDIAGRSGQVAGPSPAVVTEDVVYRTIGRKVANIDVTSSDGVSTGTCTPDPLEIPVIVDPDFQEI